MMSPKPLNIFMDGCVKEMKTKVGSKGAILKICGKGWTVVVCLFAESEEELQRVVDEFSSVSMRRKLKVNVGKSKMVVS